MTFEAKKLFLSEWDHTGAGKSLAEASADLKSTKNSLTNLETFWPSA